MCECVWIATAGIGMLSIGVHGIGVLGLGILMCEALPPTLENMFVVIVLGQRMGMTRTCSTGSQAF